MFVSKIYSQVKKSIGQYGKNNNKLSKPGNNKQEK